MAEDNIPLVEQTEHDPHEDDGTDDIPESNNPTSTNPPGPITDKTIDVSKKGENAMKTIKELLEEDNISGVNINILVIGRTGQGKSALVNSLIELGIEIVCEGSDTESCTTTSQSYTYPNIIPGVNVTIIDSPGLQDTQNKEHKYIQEMMNECHEISLVLYCMKMTDKRLINDDKVAIKMIHQAFGQKFWERVVFVLTFANDERLTKWDKDRDEDDRNEELDLEDRKIKRLKGRVQHRKNKLYEFVTELLQLKPESGHDQGAAQRTKFEVYPAGYYDPDHDDIPSNVDWQRDLVSFCCSTIKNKHKLSNLKLNKKTALAVIIDNRGKVKVENEKRILNEEAAALQKAFKDLDFAVLYFNSLSTESIATLLEAISKADHSQLLMIALVFLSKGRAPELYDADGVAVPYSAVFSHFRRCLAPVIYFFDSANGDVQKEENCTVDGENDDDVLIQDENDSTIDDTPIESDDAALVHNENGSAINDIHVQIENESGINDIHENDSADNILYAQNENNFTVGLTQDKEYFNLPKDICPENSLVLAARHCSESSPVVKEFTKKLSHTSVQECFETICANNNSTTVKSIWHDTVGNNLFIIKSINDRLDTSEQKLEAYHSIWYPIRCKTIDKMEENKKEIMSIVHKSRVARLFFNISGMVASGGLTITGIALAPFTFGASIAVSALGGVVGAAAFTGNIGAIEVSKSKNKKVLKKAQQQIELDQQISLSINKEAKKYNRIMTSAPSHIKESSAISLQGAAAIGMRGIGATIAIGAEGAVETAAIAVRTSGRVAGMALAGISLAVTIPIDIGMIAYHSYNIHKANNDPTGKTESDTAVKTLYNQIETLFKGMCQAIHEKEYEFQAGRNILKNAECGYEIEVPVNGSKTFTVTVRTLFSGPFVYPDGYTLVSAVYDITMPELSKPATIKLEHCVDESDQTRPDLCFAIGSIDLKKKKIIFQKVDQDFNGSIEQKNSCILCILYRRRLQDITVVKYGAQYFYKRSYKNFWILNIVFTKHLKAHSKHAQSICRPDFQDPCPFAFNSDSLSLDLTCFKDIKEFSGWIVSPNNREKMPDTITMKEIDTAELREGSAKVLRKAFPSISLYVYIFNETAAANEINESFEIGGTNLSININQRQE